MPGYSSNPDVFDGHSCAVCHALISGPADFYSSEEYDRYIATGLCIACQQEHRDEYDDYAGDFLPDYDYDESKDM